MKFFFDNLIDTSTIGSSSENSNFPDDNVAHDFRSRPWRTDTSSAAEWIKFDLGAAQTVTALILLDHNLQSGDTGITLEANSADSWGSPAFSQAITWNSGTILQIFTIQSYRYWRLTFTKDSASESRDIGRIFLGRSTSVAMPAEKGYDEKMVDLSQTQRALGGQTYSYTKSRYRLIKCKWTALESSDMDALISVSDSVGIHAPFFVQVGTSSPMDTIRYVKFKNLAGRKSTLSTSTYLWASTVELEEQL